MMTFERRAKLGLLAAAALWAGLGLPGGQAGRTSSALAEAELSSAPAGGAPKAAAKEEHEGEGLGEIGQVVGIVTIVLLATTVGLGVLRKANPAKLLPIHKAFGVLTLISGLVHAAIMILR